MEAWAIKTVKAGGSWCRSQVSGKLGPCGQCLQCDAMVGILSAPASPGGLRVEAEALGGPGLERGCPHSTILAQLPLPPDLAGHLQMNKSTPLRFWCASCSSALAAHCLIYLLSTKINQPLWCPCPSVLV